ncbi:MAG: hypothetical protein ACLFQ5_06280 [Oceanicaulis sp.]
MTQPLPVLDVLNTLITVNNYIMAATSARIPPLIRDDPAYAATAQEFSNWQEDVWESYYMGLIDAQILAQAREVDEYFKKGIAERGIIHEVFYGDGDITPTVVSTCDEVAGEISRGQPLLGTLEQAAKSIADVDKAKIEALTATADRLNKLFDEDEQKITDGSFKIAEDIFATVIDVGVQTAIDEDPIAPLVKGVTQVGKDVICEIALTTEVRQTLAELTKVWAELDEETAAYAQMMMVFQKLDNVVKLQSATLTALSGLVDDWSTVVAASDKDAWSSGGEAALREWADRVNRVNFAAATQIIAADTLLEPDMA